MEEATLRALRRNTGKLRLLEEKTKMVDIEAGSIVKALCGRDENKLFVVLDADGEYAHIADGHSRPLEKPKHKKLKHLKYLGNCRESKVYEKLMTGKHIENAEIRKIINLFSSEEVL